MVLKLSIAQIAGFIAIFQSLFMAFFTAGNDRRRLNGGPFLALALVAFSILIGCSLFLSMDLSSKFRRYHRLVFALSQASFLVGPFVYLHLKRLYGAPARLQARDFLHFAPFLAAFAAAVVATLSAWSFSVWRYPGRIYFSAAVLIQNAAYLGFATAFIRKRRRYPGPSRQEAPEPTWACLLLGGSLVAWLLQAQILVSWDVLRLIKFCPYTYGLYLVFGSIFFTALVYFRMRFPELFARRGRYEASPVDPGDLESCRAGLIALMEREKPYLDAELSLSRLSGRLSVAPGRLSRVINESFGINFSDFVNGYRARESATLLERFNGKRNIVDIAFDSGFNSKSAFNTAFKKHMGITPKDYQKRLLDA